MIIAIEGIGYNFEVVSQKEDKDYCFFVRATAKSGGVTSCINNLNAILSEFGIETGDAKVADSTWIVSEEEARHLLSTAGKFLLDASFLNYIEGQLDEDRMLGEWENAF